MQPQPPAWDAKMMALPGITFGAPTLPSFALSEQLAALGTCGHALKRLLIQGLQVGDFSSWLEYWNEEERWDTFADLFRAFRRTLAALPEEIRQQASNQAAHTFLAKKLPDKRESLEQIKLAQGDVSKLVREELSRPLRSEDFKAADLTCASSFNHSQLWYVIGMNSLLLVAGQGAEISTDDPDLVDGIFAITLDSAIDSLHSAYEGAHLRTVPTDTAHLTFNTTIVPTRDAQGFIGSCVELDVMTCGETEEEMTELLGQLVESCIKAEAARGTLGKTLAELLRAPSALSLSHLVIRIYSHSANAIYTQFVVIDLDA
jgi:hypothetical protein